MDRSIRTRLLTLGLRSYPLPVLQQAAAEGARFLTPRVPAWYHKINVSQLRMESDNRCLLGQLCQEPPVRYGSPYITMVASLGLQHEDRQGLGFVLRKATSWDYAMLTRCWMDEIYQRLEQEAADVAEAVERLREELDA